MPYMSDSASLGITATWFPFPAIVAGSYLKLGLDIRSFREPLKRSIQKVMAPSIRKNFDEEGRPQHWEKLKPETLVTRMNAVRNTSPIMRRTGRLRRVASQLNVWNLESDMAFVSDLPGAEYGFVHQLGVATMHRDIRVSGDIPERPFLVIQPEDEEAIETVFVDWIFERAQRSGFMVFYGAGSMFRDSNRSFDASSSSHPDFY